MEPKRTQGTQEGEASGWVCHYHTYIRLHTTKAATTLVDAMRRTWGRPVGKSEMHRQDSTARATDLP